MAKMTVSARAVDMLGRQQIAGIPTAIHELFKNAHDAYAKNVEIDYYQEQKLVTLRDDGIGMTENDFITKWLTVGTSSKYGVNRKSEFIPEGMLERPLMGEKGIGRLAIASIGRQVLVLSRAERKDGLHDLVVALIHWSQFELPDISLSDITIPTRTFPQGVLPKVEDLESMTNELLDSLKSLGNIIPDNVFELIRNDLSRFSFSPEILFKNLQKETEANWTKLTSKENLDVNLPKLDGIGRGTHFIIMPSEEILDLDIQIDEKTGTTELQKILVGFSNTLSTNSTFNLKTKFRIHNNTNSSEELIEEGFFTPEDAKNGDHYVEGEFDEYGQFKGFVTVYKSEPQEHIINWNKNFGTKTRCGKFKIKFSYIQGLPSETLVPTEVYTDIKSKLGMYGGLYLYKDGIRVLPYGKPEFDFLRFEEERSKNAGTAFFSYRLMFGSIDISHDVNINLNEKAGREGLIENIAYNQFKAILKNFFSQLASDFFRSNSVNERFSEVKEKLKSDNDREKAALAKRKEAIKEKKIIFKNEIDDFFKAYDNNDFILLADDIKSFTHKELEKISESWSDREKYKFISDLRIKLDIKLTECIKKSKITKPNIGLSETLTKEWSSYLQTKEKLNEDVIIPLKTFIENKIRNYLRDNDLSFSLRERVTGILNEDKKLLNNNIKRYKKELTSNVAEIDSAIKNKTKERTVELGNTLSSVMTEINSTPIDILPDNESSILIEKWEKEIEDIYIQTDEYFIKMRDAIEFIANDLKSGETNSIDTLIALENENEQVKGSLNQYFEFAQLGMSLGIIQHEFSSTARNVRNSIKSLKPWADKNPKLNSLYSNISHSFSHLDGYLKMFTPLNRRLYRSKVDLSGKEIDNYLKDIFEERLKRHNINWNVSHEFTISVTKVFPSTFLPVFINVVDNAIYWLNSQSSKDNPNKVISLGVGFDGLTISNNGPAIATIDKDRIFDFTFSRKESGRGMGLYISKETLNKEEFDIQLVNGEESQTSPCFVIKQIKLENE
ncbi:hypothetical protein GNP81_13400 [Aliivibrio fischeri]|uniref:ATP-binding protein n=1 Tax=Aliivibrio fischeri TaxID=668 RepID=UPI0012D874A0|nr:ATP-binding protein [Aliivibrio fischeri]MUK61533.1 hypothetical protein [Aliivibrio fischeri]MUL22196.1 hypothetical protein [Aliivibrio fischeri]MUL25589.1 hypothetical protein [Aliivibrio fischeri]